MYTVPVSLYLNHDHKTGDLKNINTVVIFPLYMYTVHTHIQWSMGLRESVVVNTVQVWAYMYMYIHVYTCTCTLRPYNEFSMHNNGSLLKVAKVRETL